ncbi:hypothetical protein ACFCX4_06915 [Kitasatospora sp. NPDC056327]|uniref:hypothetical protein n=1 Tax=Kitasatospora sp. NPDC056327 TaxID=3345785 RepID=UPI0035D766E1
MALHWDESVAQLPRFVDDRQGQYWSVSGQAVVLTFAPGYCLANEWGTPNVSTKPCDVNDRGQHWVLFGDQISLALA